MNKLNWRKVAKNTVIVAVCATPMLASAGVLEQMTEAANELDKLETGVEAIGAVIIGLAVTIKGYAVGKRLINRA